MSKALWQFGAIELMRLYRERSIAPQAVVKAILARMETVNPRLNAVVARRDEAARQEAEASAQRHAAGRALSPLDGIPITVKDSLLTADLPTTWGTPALRDHRPGHDELAVARARAAGALITGKTSKKPSVPKNKRSKCSNRRLHVSRSCKTNSKWKYSS